MTARKPHALDPTQASLLALLAGSPTRKHRAELRGDIKGAWCNAVADALVDPVLLAKRNTAAVAARGLLKWATYCRETRIEMQKARKARW